MVGQYFLTLFWIWKGCSARICKVNPFSTAPSFLGQKTLEFSVDFFFFCCSAFAGSKLVSWCIGAPSRETSERPEGSKRVYYRAYAVATCDIGCFEASGSWLPPYTPLGCTGCLVRTAAICLHYTARALLFVSPTNSGLVAPHENAIASTQAQLWGKQCCHVLV